MEALCGALLLCVCSTVSWIGLGRAHAGLAAGLGRYWGLLDDYRVTIAYYQPLVAAIEVTPGRAVADTGVRCFWGPEGTEKVHVFKGPEVGFARLLMSKVPPIHAALAPVQALAVGSGTGRAPGSR